MHVERFADPRAFLDRAELWLLAAEAEHNLLLGLARQLIGGDHPYGTPIYLATVESERGVEGCAFRTPPFKLGLTRLPESAMPALVRDVGEVYDSLPAVIGPEPAATSFAEQWTRERGGGWEMGMCCRIYSLDQVIYPASPAPGTFRAAERRDLPVVVPWTQAFIRELKLPHGNGRRLAETFVDQGALFLWEEAEPRSMAAGIGSTPNGMRVGYVYTPPEFRRRGYASVCVAALSQHLLREGRRCCFLYTDLANPSSNAIYQRIGYRPVSDVVDVHFR